MQPSKTNSSRDTKKNPLCVLSDIILYPAQYMNTPRSNGNVGMTSDVSYWHL